MTNRIYAISVDYDLEAFESYLKVLQKYSNEIKYIEHVREKIPHVLNFIENGQEGAEVGTEMYKDGINIFMSYKPTIQVVSRNKKTHKKIRLLSENYGYEIKEFQ